MTLLSRRAFLTGSALGLATLNGGLVSSCAHAAPIMPLPAPPKSDLYSASPWGVFRAGMENGRFSDAVPPFREPAPTSMLAALPDLPYAANRVRYPMVRTDFLKNGHDGDRTDRGRGNFTRVSWDEALDLVTREIRRVSETYGPHSLYCGAGSRSSSGKFHDPAVLLERLFLLNGGCTSRYAPHQSSALHAILPHVVGRSHDQPTAWPVIIAHSTLVVLWGADLLSENQTDDSVADPQTWAWFRTLKQKGTKVICIGPVRTPSTDFFDAEWIRLRPQSDVALMLGIAHTLFVENRHDTAFLARATRGFDRFHDYLTGTDDGKAKDAEWAARITDVPPAVIRDLARLFAENRTILMGGRSLHEQEYGEQAPWMMVTLAAMLGQIGLPGGGFGFDYHHSGAGTPPSRSPVLPSLTTLQAALFEEKGSQIERFPASRLIDMLERPGEDIDINGKQARFPDIRLMYWAGSNPFHHQPDRNRLILAWQKAETVIINEPYWTPTAKFADIVLPTATQFERNDIEQGGTYSARFIVAMHKLLDPQFESQTDFQIFSALAERLGIGDDFHEGRSETEWIRLFYREAQRQAVSLRFSMPDFETFWKERQILDFSPEPKAETFVQYADFRNDPEGRPLSTPSGKIEIVSETIAAFGYDDCPAFPQWIEPSEWIGNAHDGPFPLALVVAPSPWRMRSQLNNISLRETYEINGREPVFIHPDDAAARGIDDGDVVRLHNRRGDVLAAARLSDAVRPGVIRLYEGSWYDPAQPGVPHVLCKHGDVHLLTSPRITSRLAQASAIQSVMVEVEKFSGLPPPVTAFSTPEGA